MVEIVFVEIEGYVGGVENKYINIDHIDAIFVREGEAMTSIVMSSGSVFHTHLAPGEVMEHITRTMSKARR